LHSAAAANNRQEMKKMDDSLSSGLIFLMQSPSTKVQCQVISPHLCVRILLHFSDSLFIIMQAALAVRNLASDGAIFFHSQIF